MEESRQNRTGFSFEFGFGFIFVLDPVLAWSQILEIFKLFPSWGQEEDQQTPQPAQPPRPVMTVAAPVAPVHQQCTAARETSAAITGVALRPRACRIYNFKHLKIKVGIDGQDDVDRVGAIRRRVGRKMDIRIDANEAWTPENAAGGARYHAEPSEKADRRPRGRVPGDPRSAVG